MIYVHFEKLANIIEDGTHAHQSLLKSAIYEHRHGILGQFCTANHLPIPSYAKQSFGKPIITNSHLAFNQSHSNGGYALVFSLTVQKLGVDTENRHRQVNFDAMARRFFHVDEYAFWQDNDCDRLLWFKIWTIKEAVLKASGLGIRMRLNELNAKFINDHQGSLFHQKIGQYRFECMAMSDDIVTIAYEGDDQQTCRWLGGATDS